MRIIASHSVLQTEEQMIRPGCEWTKTCETRPVVFPTLDLWTTRHRSEGIASLRWKLMPSFLLTTSYRLRAASLMAFIVSAGFRTISKCQRPNFPSAFTAAHQRFAAAFFTSARSSKPFTSRMSVPPVQFHCSQAARDSPARNRAFGCLGKSGTAKPRPEFFANATTFAFVSKKNAADCSHRFVSSTM